MNSRIIFNEFAKKVQSDRDYYIFGKPSQIGMIEDTLAFFGLDYEIKSHSGSMHENNLKILRDFIINKASDEQLKLINEFVGNNKPLPIINPLSDTAGKVFVSMPMNHDKCADIDIIREGIGRGIRNTGNEPYFLGKDAHNMNITVKMIDEISSCKFLVADFTTHNTGVYYEAGYARALGKTVIHTCKKDDFQGLHFDVKQIQTLSWSNSDELADSLSKQITASGLGIKNQ
ncbi:uncharacterized protein BN500_00080 [Clostridium sp. CAG:149]|nr:uncharacterized protein BN500_00080 [Clostridium sp. CAG:149]